MNAFVSTAQLTLSSLKQSRVLPMKGCATHTYGVSSISINPTKKILANLDHWPIQSRQFLIEAPFPGGSRLCLVDETPISLSVSIHALCFWTVGAMRPAASSGCYQDFPTMMDYDLEVEYETSPILP